MKIYLYNGKANIIGPRIRQARKALKISQDMLSARLQIQGIELTQKSISRIETQERVVADYELCALAAALEVDVNWLLNFNNTSQDLS